MFPLGSNRLMYDMFIKIHQIKVLYDRKGILPFYLCTIDLHSLRRLQLYGKQRRSPNAFAQLCDGGNNILAADKSLMMPHEAAKLIEI